jgi:hypothetical protein
MSSFREACAVLREPGSNLPRRHQGTKKSKSSAAKGANGAKDLSPLISFLVGNADQICREDTKAQRNQNLSAAKSAKDLSPLIHALVWSDIIYIQD